MAKFIRLYIWVTRFVLGFCTMLVMYSYVPQIDEHLKPVLRPFLMPYSMTITTLAVFGVSYTVIVAVMKSIGD